MKTTTTASSVLLALLSTFVSVKYMHASAEIVNVTATNWDAVTTSADGATPLGIVLIVCSSLEFAREFYDSHALENMYNGNDDRLVGFVDCRTDEKLCQEMGWYTNPTLRYRRANSLQDFLGTNRGTAADFLPAMVDKAMTYKINPAFSPASLQITAGPSLAELSKKNGNAVLARYCSLRSGECRRTQPDWDRLALQYSTSETIVIAEVDCGSDDLHPEHEHTCSWSSTLPVVKYGLDGSQDRIKRSYNQGPPEGLDRFFDFDTIKSIAEALDASTRVNPTPLTSVNWDESIDAKNVMVLFTSPSCCGLAAAAPDGGFGCFDGLRATLLKFANIGI